MAVQAEYSPEAFFHDFRFRTPINMMEGLRKRNGDRLAGIGILNADAVFSGGQSELTCNGSASKKRRREVSSSIHPSTLCNQLQYPNLVTVSDDFAISADLAYGSVETSTSYRPSVAQLPVVSQIQHHSLEIDALVRFQVEKLRFGLEEMSRRHSLNLSSIIEQELVQKLKEKELQLQIARRRNAELEESVRQLSTENEIWFNAAKNSEAIACSLRSCIDQVILQSSATVAPEGYGESEGEDAQSCCFAAEPEFAGVPTAETRRRFECRVCGVEEASVLLLPCRHLCLCSCCEPKIDTCPICSATKIANVKVIV